MEQESAADMFVLLAPSSSSAALSPQPAEMRRPELAAENMVLAAVSPSVAAMSLQPAVSMVQPESAPD